jgi:DNA invertase Pin-like site-specific DNA recombinase
MNGGNMERKKIRAVIYCRVGNESQVDGGMALTTQNVLLRHQAARENIDIVGEVQVCEKGITLNRPGWHEALNLAAKNKADAIFVTKYDRVARGTLLLEQAIADMDKLGLKLHTGMEKFPVLKGRKK